MKTSPHITADSTVIEPLSNRRWTMHLASCVLAGGVLAAGAVASSSGAVISDPVFIDAVVTSGGLPQPMPLEVGPGGIPVGASLFVVFADSAVSPLETAISDSVGNSYVQDLYQHRTNSGALDGNVQVFRAPVLSALSEGDVINVTHQLTSNDNKAVAHAFYVEGLALDGPLDVLSGGVGDSSMADPGEITTSVAEALILGVVGWSRYLGDFGDGDSAYTTISTDGADVGTSTRAKSVHSAFQIVEGGGTFAFNPTFGGIDEETGEFDPQNVRWAAGLAAYRAVPEPASLAMALMGGLALLTRQRQGV